MKKLKDIKIINLKSVCLLGVIFLLSGWIINALAQEVEKHKIDINALISDTQKSSTETNKMQLIWWLPEEYWNAFLKEDKTMTEEGKEEFLKVLRPYILFAIVDGKIGPFGSITYKAEADIRNGLRLKDSKGNYFRPLSEDQIDADTRSFLAMFKPYMVNIIGTMGENMHFFVFPGKNDKGQRIVEPKKKGEFTILLSADEYKWRLPLSSLIPPKICPKCKEKCSGAWNYCPWCGTKLPE